MNDIEKKIILFYMKDIYIYIYTNIYINNFRIYNYKNKENSNKENE